MTENRRERRAYMRLDPEKVRLRLIALGMSDARLKEKTRITEETWQRIVAGKGIWMDTAVRVQNALEVKSLLEIVHPAKLAELAGLAGGRDAVGELPDWERETPVTGCVTASNGLKYFVWKLRHRTEQDRFARGKRYDLTSLRTKDQDRLRNYLVRHAEICNQLAGHPRLPRHLTTVPAAQGDAWWMLDEWTPGPTLGELLLPQKLQAAVLPRVMRQIAEGLKALHEVKIIRRDLSPSFILVREADQSVVLTDFELGKLFDGSPTVADELLGNPYRAPEVGGQPLKEDDLHVDLYSWGRILVHAATGGLPAIGHEDSSLEAAGLPPKVRDIAKRCLDVDPKQRPQSADEVLKAIRWWK